MILWALGGQNLFQCGPKLRIQGQLTTGPSIKRPFEPGPRPFQGERVAPCARLNQASAAGLFEQVFSGVVPRRTTRPSVSALAFSRWIAS